LPEPLEELTGGELTQRAGRPLREEEIGSLEALGVLERRPDGGFVLHGTAAPAPALADLGAGAAPELLRRTPQLVHQHMNALADDLMRQFQDEVLQPYRDRGRPVAERVRIGELFTRLKPITVQGVITAFGRAVNRTIRERLEP